MSEPAGIELALRILQEGLLLCLLVAAPILVAMLATGVITSALGAFTQVQDHAVGFVPRLIVAVMALVILGPHLGAQVVRFASAVFTAVGQLH
ncbi:MAG: flagellar biosynthetic protein FliQ [Myxococcales bacterium]|nr:flagellar biosynthetic protein FliQ [Myxococcales bacterium]